MAGRNLDALFDGELKDGKWIELTLVRVVAGFFISSFESSDSPTRQ
jgi:hypothetical protein